MKLDQFSCEKCGANDFVRADNFSFRCTFCGGLITKPAEQHPSPLPYQNEHTPLQSENNDNTIFRIFGMAAGVLIMIIILIVSNQDSTKRDQNSENPPKPSAEELASQALTEILSRQPNRSENGISAASVELISENGMSGFSILFSNRDYRIRIEKPEGFTIEKKKIFAGKSFEIRDIKNAVVFQSGDIDSLSGEQGEKQRVYSDSLTMDFTTNSRFGFKDKGAYTVYYRVWDKKSKKYMTGTIPVYIEF